MIDPSKPDDAIRQLAETVDTLSGQVAALIQYIAATTSALAEDKVTAVKREAQTSAPQPLSANTHPKRVAVMAVDQILYASRQRP